MLGTGVRRCRGVAVSEAATMLGAAVLIDGMGRNEAELIRLESGVGGVVERGGGHPMGGRKIESMSGQTAPP
jgi:hypothetical protein